MKHGAGEELLDKVTNEDILRVMDEKKSILHTVRHRKAHWIAHMLRRCLHDFTEGTLVAIQGEGEGLPRIKGGG